ncbi:uncharacterized protein DDB_G0283697-like isoform X2 [Orussus abietinus]|uniref:uncharacterized protein DDB_G0283697-like isoform X2 n=1 Tax=Orussus abietinus TaxID=222816 RepID=UPI0006265298|nr:uncharacterized protein DDB_G0283697-like isoform X2 [Orussus abietinus]
MRRLSMKGKRRKSESSSDGDSEENGVGSGVARGSDRDVTSPENDAASAPAPTPVSAPAVETAKKPAKKRNSRARGKQHEDKLNESNGGEEQQQRNSNISDEQENGKLAATPAPGKRRKKDEQKASTSQNKVTNEEEYEVEKVVAYRTIKGRRQFLVRWKNYGEEADTWEQEKDLNCPELIEEFLSQNEETSTPEKPVKTAKAKQQHQQQRKTEKPKKSKIVSKKDFKEAEEEEDSGDEKGSKEFEVEKIIEVHFKKNKSREFLIRWKGFTSADDTWEPEEHLNCPELIAKFMEKVEKARKADIRELRTNPAHTKRYTLSTHESGRRLSRRNIDKQRKRQCSA